MFKDLNTKILGVAMMPVYLYVLLCIYAFVNSGFEWSAVKPWLILLIIVGMSISALCFSLKQHTLHIIALLILLIIGALIAFSGLREGVHTFELIMAAILIAFAFSMYEFVHKRTIE